MLSPVRVRRLRGAKVAAAPAVAMPRGRLGAGRGGLPAADGRPPPVRRGGARALPGVGAGVLGPAADVLGAAVRGRAPPAGGGEGSSLCRPGDFTPHAFVGESSWCL